MNADEQKISEILDLVEHKTYYPTTTLRKNKKYKALHEYIMAWTSKFTDLPYTSRIYYTVNKLTEYLKCANPACQKELRHDIKLKRPFNRPSIAHCCHRCAQLDPTTKLTIEQTCLEKYGCTHPSQSKRSREKMKNTLANKPQSHWDNSTKRRKSTCLERYGVSHVMQVKEIAAKCVDKFKSRPEEVKKAQIARSIQKKIELYGDGGNGKKVSETKKLFSAEKKAEIRKRREATLKEKYGVSCSFHTETARHKSSAARLSKAYDEIMSKDKYVEAMFSKEQYIADPDGQLTWKCRKCGKVFHSIKRWHYSHALNSVARCLDCYPLRGRNSSIESQFTDFIKSLNAGDVIRNTRDVIPPRELDVYLPEKKTAVEFNGLRWHSLELGTEPDYHMSKSDECAAKGVFLLHIFENEWIWNKETTQKYMQTALGVFNRHEDTNNCICQEIDSAEQNIFYAENSIAFHEDMPAIGLKKNGELLFCCQYEKQNGIIVVKNAISKSGVQTHKALDACIDLIEQTMRPKEIHILIDRRLQQMPKLTGYDIIESKSIPPAKFFYTLADKKHLIPEQNLSQDASVMFTHFNAGYFLFTVKCQNA